MLSSQQIEELSEQSVINALSSQRNYVNAMVHKIDVNPRLKRRMIWGWCDTTEMEVQGIVDHCDSFYSIVFFKENQVVGKVDRIRSTDESPGSGYFPDFLPKVAFTDCPGPDAMLIRNAKDNISTVPVFLQAQFYVNPIRIIGDFDSVGLFVETVLATQTINFRTGLRVRSQNL